MVKKRKGMQVGRYYYPCLRSWMQLGQYSSRQPRKEKEREADMRGTPLSVCLLQSRFLPSSLSSCPTAKSDPFWPRGWGMSSTTGTHRESKGANYLLFTSFSWCTPQVSLFYKSQTCIISCTLPSSTLRVRKGRSLSRGEIYLSSFFFSESISVVLCESRWWWWWAEGRHHLTSPCPSLTTRQSMEWMKPEGDVPWFSSLPADCMGSISSHRINQSVLSFFPFPSWQNFLLDSCSQPHDWRDRKWVRECLDEKEWKRKSKSPHQSGHPLIFSSRSGVRSSDSPLFIWAFSLPSQVQVIYPHPIELLYGRDSITN